ncbi:class I SAM-dependent DNA methyltransferase [Hymenobacter taeanensis]|uniref:site-specific DNA-methyltransferase (adenine-specific) n=2 Tax=Hymenobacter taeanensis TaxID=2735321 RepID=A0A6M6BKI7_9BACT|nr:MULTISPECIES: TaqI-like C-terminal specificity domain-containing protein [Hymenobacter]QJX48344.1 class I SAM-dependent DNA methyltransferase [Hymenobacter taeanensis]UOQ82164.1 Eco57I restriction-modification methylase domain-containing protein [Hymenobacter sp. 5414T-23]
MFDAHEFHRVFWKYPELRQQFQKFKQGQTTAPDTSHFYQEIARPLLDKLETEVRFTYFTLDPHDEKGQRKELGEKGRLWLSKLFSPPHLLKEPFAQDANTLNRAFYEELLYLMGLEEVKDKGRKLIQRCALERRQRGSLLENTLVQLRAEDMLRNLPAEELSTYGDTPEQQAEGVALALCLTWVSRLLFLKLLEGQLRRYHQPGPVQPFRFLDPGQLKEYDLLNRLFYRILNRPTPEREQPEAGLYPHVPYLNSSLFEPSALERRTLRISGLDDMIELPLLGKKGKTSRSVLRQEAGGPAPTALTYLLRFLDAYDFASEGSEEVHDDDRPLISAAVLGLIFEKINGYRDGSFYTPGFITMYMCRHTLRRAVVRHFNERYGWQAEDVSGLEEQIADEPKRRPEFSEAFNELRVLDPAVGSGHFLVSALNELLAIKSELGLLLDTEGKRLRYRLTVARDELAVTSDEDDTLFEYRATWDEAAQTRRVGREHTRLQSALFREKRLLIEHCLYGVDLNPNSVRICRLRLWIELLKHAYYTPESQFRELETLPNLELNVRAGNSLISRYPLQADLTEVFRKKDFSLALYRRAVGEFFSARGREQKQVLEDFLQRLKDQFRTDIQRHDPLLKRITRAKEDLLRAELDQKPDLFGKARLTADDAWAKQTTARLNLEKLEQERQQREQGTLFRDAFEWRFEFPEVLAPDGSFRGFDAVLGNPPYIRQEELAPALKPYLKAHYETSAGTADLYVYFYELGLRLLAPGGELSFITNNKWLRAGYGQGLRRYLLRPELRLQELLDFGDLPVFPEATTYPNILSVQRAPAAAAVRVAELTTLGSDPTRFPEVVQAAATDMPTNRLSDDAWSLAAADKQQLLEKLRAAGTPLGQYVDGKIYYGIKTGYNEAFVIDAATRAALISEDPKSAEIIKPFLAGRDVKRYQLPKADKYLIYTPWSLKITDYLAIEKHLKQHFDVLSNRPEVLARRYPWYALSRYAAEYVDDFAKSKIVIAAFSQNAPYAYDTDGCFSNDKTTIIPSNDLFLLGALNSSSVDFFFKSIASTKAGGYFEYKPMYLSQLPIPTATAEQQAPIVVLVEQVLAAKAADATADTQPLEQQIDALVAELYGLTPEETALLTA